eukprot:3746629-Alexandrium_andersonii.AAC.1
MPPPVRGLTCSRTSTSRSTSSASAQVGLGATEDWPPVAPGVCSCGGECSHRRCTLTRDARGLRGQPF